MNRFAKHHGRNRSLPRGEEGPLPLPSRAARRLIKNPAGLYNALMASAAPQSPENAGDASQRQEPFLRLQSVMIYVRNLDRSLEFYLEILGFQVVFDGRKQQGQPGQPWVVVAPPDGTANLTLIVPRTDSEQFKQIGRASHVTFVT